MVTGSLLRVFSAPPASAMARIVEIPKEARDSAWIVRLIYQALGFSGAVFLLTAVVGLLLAGILLWLRARRMEEPPVSIMSTMTSGRAR